MATLRIDWCGSDEVAALQTFIATHWPTREHVLARDAGLLRWQYRRHDGGDGTSVLGAWRGQELVGFLGVIETGFCVRGEQTSGGWLAMWVVAPDARETGAGLRLLREALQHYTVAGCVGFNETAERLFVASGFSICQALPRWTRAVDVEALERLVHADATRYGPDVRAVWRGQAARLVDAGAGADPWSDDAALAWDRTWGDLVAPRYVGTWRDSRYLAWRYVEHPGFEYELRVCRGDRGSVEGLLVYRVEQVRDRAERVLRIVELLGEPAALRRLAAAAVAAGEDAGVAFVDASLTLRDAGDALESAGFIREGGNVPTLPSLFQPLDSRRTRVPAALRCGPESGLHGEPLFERRDVYVTRADGDQDRPN